MLCQLGKQTVLPFNKSVSHALSSFDLIHSDVWGPSPIPTQGESRYFVIFVDDFSRYTWIYLFKNRSELSQIYRDFTKMIETQFSKPIKVFRSDNAHEFTDILHQSGIIPHSSCAGTSQQNGRAERKLRYILDVVVPLLLPLLLLLRFGGKLLLLPFIPSIGVRLLLLRTKLLMVYCLVLLPPMIYSEFLDVSVLFFFTSMNETNFSLVLVYVVFLGMVFVKKGYRCYDPISKRLRVSRHVVFWEHKMFYKIPHVPESPISSIDPVLDLFPEETPPTILALTPSTSDLPSDEPPAPIIDVPYDTAPAVDPAGPSNSHALRRSHRVTTLPSHLRDFHCFSALAYLQEPQSFREASSNPLWQQAMKEELDALHNTGTWDLIDLPPGKSAIGCKWIYKIKTRSDGTVDCYKARLVARGFTQEYGIDYEETFAPIARLSSVRTLIAISAARRWPLFQMDVKNVFLNGELAEEVYMKLPLSYSQPPGFPNRVCRLQRTLYGLKQDPRAWFEKFSSTISQHGFSGSSFDTALFLRRSDHGTTILLLYVNDMIITGDDMQGIQDLKLFLGSQFEMKDLGPLNYFLGIEVSSSVDGYYLTQAKYTSDLISRANITDSKIVDTPIEYNYRLNSHDGESLSDATLYRQLVGSLIYLTVTRPDISYAVHIVSQFMAAPRSPHYAAILRILRYLKGTIFDGLHFSSHSSLTLQAYSDADWAGDPTDRRSTTGYCFMLGDSLIYWRSKKQTVVARSSTEAEYRALAATTAELIWLRWLLRDLGIDCSAATQPHCDNQSAIQIAHNDVFHERTKHIEIDCHFIRQHVLQGTITLQSVSSQDQLADIFTKPLSPRPFRVLTSKLKMVSLKPP